MLFKKANATLTVSRDDIVEPEVALSTEGASQQFKKLVAEVKRVAPRSEEFTYFRCIAIHAMEAANLDTQGSAIHKGHISVAGDDGNCKVCGTALNKDAQGSSIDGLWCIASDIDPYVNQNGDAFPEAQLLEGYKSFIGRGLFVNHASSDVEKIRGIILDAAWVPQHKRVELLVALDKTAFPELARQIQAGYSNDVSMGTQVSFSRCSKCGNKAITENDYCTCVRDSKGLTVSGSKIYEVNYGLNFIEISLVTTGADPQAKIRQVLASLNRVLEQRVDNKCNSEDGLCQMGEAIQYANEKVNEVEKEGSIDVSVIKGQLASLQGSLGTIGEGKTNEVERTLASIKSQIDNIESKLELDSKKGEISMTKAELDARKLKRRAYFQGTEEPQTYAVEPEGGPNGTAETARLTVEKGGEAATVQNGEGKGDIAIKEKLQRAELENRKLKRHALMSEAYFQGTEEPQTYPVDPAGGPSGSAETERLNSAKEGESSTMGDGEGGELGKGTRDKGYTKEMLQRAKLRAKFTTASEKKDCAWTIYAGDEPVIRATVGELYGEDIDKANNDDGGISNWDWVSSKEYGIEAIRACKEIGITKAAEMMGKKVVIAEGEEEFGAPADVDIDLNIETEGDEGAEEAHNIPDALEQIESAVGAIRELEEPTEESLDLEEDLGTAETELQDLGEAAPTMSSSDKFRKLTAEAISDAKTLIAAANGIVAIAAKNKVQKCEEDLAKCKEDLKDAKKDGKAERTLKILERKIEKAKECLKNAKDNAAAKAAKKEEKEAAAEAEAKEEAKAKAKEDKAKAKAKDEPKAKKAASLTDRAKARRVAAGLEVEATAGASLTDRAKARRVAAGLEVEAENTETQNMKETTDATKDLTDEVKKLNEEKKKLESSLSSVISSRSQARWAAAESLYGVTPSFDATKEAHPQGGTVTEDGTGKAVDGVNDGARIETGTEAQATDIDIANSQPRGELTARQKARKEVVAELQTDATADPKAKDYWSSYFAEGKDQKSNAFGKEMSEETSAPIKKAETDNLKLSMKRAYQIAMKQAEIGQIKPGKESLEAQVDALVGMDQQAFTSFARAVENSYPVKKAESMIKDKLTKTAGSLQVGVNEPEEDLTTQLTRLDWKI